MNAADDRSFQDQANPGRYQHSPRVYWIRYPPTAIKIRQVSVLVVGALIAGLVGFGIVLFFLAFVSAALEGAELYVSGIIAFLVSLVAPILLVYGWGRGERSRRLNQPPGRGDRLSKLVQTGIGMQRFPHRAIELCVRNHRTDWYALKSVMRYVPPGTVIVANGPRLGEEVRPRGGEIPFEPIELGDEFQRLTWVTNQDMAAPEQAGPTAEENEDSLHHQMQLSWHFIKRHAPIGMLALWIAYLLYGAVTTGINVTSAAIGVLLAMSLGGDLGAFFHGQRYWLVPGGLIHGETGAWSSHVKATLYTRDDSALFMDLRGEFVMVCRDQTVLRFTSSVYHSWGILSGWLSRARTPTLEEVLAFTGAEGDSDRTST